MDDKELLCDPLESIRRRESIRYFGLEDTVEPHSDWDSTGHHCTVLYCTVLYCTVLYCTVLYCTVLYCTVLYCTVLYCTVLYCTVLYCTVLYCTVLYCTVLYCTVLYCTVLYCTVLYCTVLYCTVLYCTVLTGTPLDTRSATVTVTLSTKSPPVDVTLVCLRYHLVYEGLGVCSHFPVGMSNLLDI